MIRLAALALVSLGTATADAKLIKPLAKPYLRPVGETTFDARSRHLSVDNGLPGWFLLSPAELGSYRYSFELGLLVDGMVAELAAVIDEGCAGNTCAGEIEKAREKVSVLIGETRSVGAPRIKRWTSNAEGLNEEKRQFRITESVGKTSIEVVCTVTSWTVGMQMWNDIAECEATVRDRGRMLARYTPTTLRGRDKESLLNPLDAYDQVVTFPSGTTVTIESGYNYNGDDVTTRRTKAAPRSMLTWATP